MAAAVELMVDGEYYEYLGDMPYEVLTTGFLAGSGKQKHTFTYSGEGTLLGYATTEGATTPDTGFAVGDTGTIPMKDGMYYFYSVADTGGGGGWRRE